MLLAASAGAATALSMPTETAVAPTITAILRIKLFIVSPPLVFEDPADRPMDVVCAEAQPWRQPEDASPFCIAKTCNSWALTRLAPAPLLDADNCPDATSPKPSRLPPPVSGGGSTTSVAEAEGFEPSMGF